MGGQYRGQYLYPRQQPQLDVRQYSTDDVLAHGHSAVKHGVFCSRIDVLRLVATLYAP